MKNKVQVKQIFPHQLLLVKSTAFVSAIVGGFGSGKSYALGFCEVDWMQRESPMSPTIACAPTHKQLDQSTLKHLKKLLTECDIDFVHGSQPPASWNVPLRKFYRKWLDIITLETGHLIVCASLDEPDSLRGPEYGLALMDELAFCTDDEGFKVVQSRMRCPYTDNHRIRIATSPPPFPNWFWHEFGNPARRNQAYEVIHATTLDNTKLPGHYTSILKENYSNERYRREVLGQWVFVGGGIVLTEFDWERHVKSWDYQKGMEIHIGADFNVAPMAWTIAQVDSRDRSKYIFDELYIEKDATTHAACEMVRSKYRNETIYVYPDCSCSFNRTSSATASVTDLSIMEEHGFIPMMPGPKNPPIVDRIEAVQAAFRENKLFISPDCKYTLESVMNTSYIEGTRRVRKQRPGEQGAGEHPVDALGYFVFSYDIASSGITKLSYYNR